ncbi:MAG: peptide ABC transporter substrate-binding protein [Proteobacteria bacterium]|nr:peptide ABC transporter substrate-binding protein [Pseudomonadota bacterium]
MLRARTFWMAALWMATLAAVLPACSSSTPAQHGMVLNRGNGGEPKTLDPQQIDGTWESNIVGDMLIGLTTDDPEAKPIPGAALSWETSADGKTWTFHIRPHLWSDGVPVTAHDFVFAWQHLLDPRTASAYAYNLWLVKNGQQISAGNLPPTALGVSAPDDKTFVVALEHPAPYLLELLTHHSTFPLPKHVVEKYGAQWTQPGHIVSNGPYMLKDWRPNDHLTLIKNPKFYDAKTVRIDTVNFYPTTDTQAALKQFRAGALDTQNPLPALEIDWMRAHIPDALQIKPYLGIAYMVANSSHKPFDDVRIREAIDLAVNREMIAQRIYKLGEPAAYSIVPSGVANYPGGTALRFKTLSYDQRIERAQALMTAAGYGPSRHLQTTYSATTDNDNKRAAAAIQSMLRAIYIDVEIVSSDIQIHFANLQSGNFDLAGAAWIADFNDASNFLDLLRGDSGKNYGRYNRPAYDALLDKAQQQADAKARGEILKQAEQMALDDYAWIPVRYLVTRDLVQPYVKGWKPNLRNFNRTRWLWVEKH